MPLRRLLGLAIFVASLDLLAGAAAALITAGALDTPSVSAEDVALRDETARVTGGMLDGTPFEGCDALTSVGRDTGTQFLGEG
jgi:hypothetical protein